MKTYSFHHYLLIAALVLLLASVEEVESFSIVPQSTSSSASCFGTTTTIGRPVVSLRAKEESDDDDDDDEEEEKKFVVDESAPLLEVKNLGATIAANGEKILKGVDLTINKGETHVIMGTNGSGKSTFSKVLVGFPGYDVSDGSEILYKGSSVLELDPAERSHLGLFLAFQYPVELPGVSNEDFLRLAYNSKREYEGQEPVEPLEFMMICTEKLQQVKMDPKFLSRNVNEGFSGGEKKRNEILQMVLLDSQLSILDETDSGLDIDALKVVAEGINKFKDSDSSKSVVMITHYQRLLDYVKPDFVHVMKQGRIVKSGGASLALELEDKGYDWLDEEVAV